MKLKILSSAIDDLYQGRLFYERQGEGVGDYFFDSLFSDIDSLTLCTIPYRGKIVFSFGVFWICVKIRRIFGEL